jgi:NADH:ubiquinone oxidoreductase subunit 3 (subunit A)
MEKYFIAIGGVIVFYATMFYFTNKLLTRLRKKSMERVANKMVESGEITREQADAIIWIINYSSKKKK